jgi:hypothetical protein
MTRNLRKMYSVVGALLLLEFLAQFYTIASSGFTSVANKIANAGNPSAASAVDEIDVFGAAHAVNGVFVVPITILALIILSFAARYPRKTTVMAAILFLLWAVQFALAFVGFLGVVALAGLHGINALVMVGLGIYLVRSNWAFWSQAPATTQPNGIRL